MRYAFFVSNAARFTGHRCTCRMAAIQFVLTKYPVSRGAVIQMLARLQHGKGEGIPAVDKVAPVHGGRLHDGLLRPARR